MVRGFLPSLDGPAKASVTQPTHKGTSDSPGRHYQFSALSDLLSLDTSSGGNQNRRFASDLVRQRKAALLGKIFRPLAVQASQSGVPTTAVLLVSVSRRRSESKRHLSGSSAADKVALP
jgi:hypothetical protein